MLPLTLYHTEGCHLCEQAEELAMAAFKTFGLAAKCLVRIEIADDPSLMERYGVRIPVLRDQASGRELDWPFSQEEIRSMLMR